MLTTPLAAAAPGRIEQLLRRADAARLAGAVPRRGSARLALPPAMADALRTSLRRSPTPTPVPGPAPTRGVCCA